MDIFIVPRSENVWKTWCRKKQTLCFQQTQLISRRKWLLPTIELWKMISQFPKSHQFRKRCIGQWGKEKLNPDQHTHEVRMRYVNDVWGWKWWQMESWRGCSSFVTPNNSEHEKEEAVGEAGGLEKDVRPFVAPTETTWWFQKSKRPPQSS